MAFFGALAGKAAQPMMGVARALPQRQGLGPSQNTMMSRMSQGMQPKTAQPLPQSGPFNQMGKQASPNYKPTGFTPQLPSMPAPMQDDGMLKPAVMPRFNNGGGQAPLAQPETPAPELGQTPEQQIQQQQRVQDMTDMRSRLMGGGGLGPRQGMWQNLMNRFNQARPQPYGQATDQGPFNTVGNVPDTAMSQDMQTEMQNPNRWRSPMQGGGNLPPGWMS